MKNAINLKELDINYAKIQGREYAIEDKITSKVYISNKQYSDKLFREAGWGSVGVIKVLEDYAGKYVSEIGNLKDSKIFIDEVSGVFIVTSDNAINWVNSMYDRFDKEGIKIIEKKASNPYYSWDQILIKSPTGTYFAIYINLVDEYVRVLSLDYSQERYQLNGSINEGDYLFSDGNSSLESLMVLLLNPINISNEFKLDAKLSLHEYIELLVKLGYVKKGRKTYYITDLGEDKKALLFPDLDLQIDEFNISSWIKRHIKEVPGGFTFSDGCELISLSLVDHMIWDFNEFFMSNAREQSDYFLALC